MSKFKKASAEVELLTDALTALEAEAVGNDKGSDSSSTSSGGSSSSDGKKSDEALTAAHVARLTDLDRRLTVLEPELAKMLATANETDKDKIIFGEKMAANVRALHAQFTLAQQMAAELRTALAEGFAAVEAGRAAAEQQRVLALERHAEQERARAEQERGDREAAESARLARLAAVKEEEAAAAELKDATEQSDKAEYLRVKQAKEEAEAAARDLNLKDCLKLVEDNCADRLLYRAAVIALHALAKHLVEEPSDPRFRHLRKNNPQLQKDVLQLVGGSSCLLAIGFREKDLTKPTAETYFVMAEPDISDLDRYMAQIDHLTQCRDLLEDYATRRF
jgi:hypothetical protein